MHVRLPATGLGKPMEGLEFAARSVFEFVLMCKACAETGADEVEANNFDRLPLRKVATLEVDEQDD
jgi:hypothetical protein